MSMSRSVHMLYILYFIINKANGITLVGQDHDIGLTTLSVIVLLLFYRHSLFSLNR